MAGSIHEQAQAQRIAELESQLKAKENAQRIAELESQLAAADVVPDSSQQQPVQQAQQMSDMDKEKLYLTRAGRWCLTAVLVILILWITSPIWSSLIVLLFAGLTNGSSGSNMQTIDDLSGSVILLAKTALAFLP